VVELHEMLEMTDHPWHPNFDAPTIGSLATGSF
jgi:hypothetical protein